MQILFFVSLKISWIWLKIRNLKLNENCKLRNVKIEEKSFIINGKLKMVARIRCHIFKSLGYPSLIIKISK